MNDFDKTRTSFQVNDARTAGAPYPDIAISGAANRVDLGAPGANMFGILPCPKCASVYRWPHQDGRLICDECHYEVQGDFAGTTGHP